MITKTLPKTTENKCQYNFLFEIMDSILLNLVIKFELVM